MEKNTVETHMRSDVSRLVTGAALLLALAAGVRPAAWAGDPASEGKTVVDASGVSETTYANGLTLLVKPLPDCPMVTTMIWYAVGSRDEDVAETGLSHYLEHMLFKGTEKYPVGMIDKVTQRNGGTNNASTRNDATEYHFSFPADRWEAALEIEADRMRGSKVEQKEFDAEKNVVLQELKRGLDDPADVLMEAVGSAAFPVGRYHHPVIGWPEDVRSTTRERMMAYYLKHYTPDRATLVVVGGVDRDRVIKRVGELFGAIPRGTIVRHEMVEPPSPGETRLTFYQDTQIPRLIMTFRSVKILDPREPLLDLVSSILQGEKTSRLDKALVDTGIAAGIGAWSDTRRDDGVFTIVAQPAPGHTIDEIETVVKKVLAELVEKGVTKEEIALARAKILAARVFSEERSMGVAERLGSLAVVGDWRYTVRYPAALEAATPESVLAIAKVVFDPTKAVVGRSFPKAKPAEGGGSCPADEKGANAGGRRRSDAKGGFNVCWRDGADDTGAGAAIDRALTLTPVRKILPNGLTVLVLQRKSSPVFSAMLSVENGRLGEAAPGLDALTGALLEEGTTKHTPEQLEQIIGAVGGALAPGSAGATVKTLSKDAALALDVLAEVVTQPAFTKEAVERIKERQVAEIDEELDTPQAIAKTMFDAAVYGKDHPLGRYVKGSAVGVRALTREQVLGHHAKFFAPKNAVLAIVTDRDPAQVMPEVERSFGGWTGGEKPELKVPPVPAPKAVESLKSLSREQTNLFLGHVGIERKDPDFVALEVMDNVFGTGAGFTDRLSKTIRDQAGLAYTVYGNVTRSAALVPGQFVMFAGTNPADAPKARAMMHEQLKLLLSAAPTTEEVDGAKSAMRGNMVASCESSDGLLAMLRLCERYGLGFDYPKRYLEALEKITPDEVLRVAKAHLHPDALVEVVVGPQETK